MNARLHSSVHLAQPQRIVQVVVRFLGDGVVRARREKVKECAITIVGFAVSGVECKKKVVNGRIGRLLLVDHM